MRRLLRVLKTTSVTLERAAIYLAASGLLLMAACILVQIVARYIFSEPPAWTEELARHAMIWSGFAGATAAYSRRTDPVLVNAASLKHEWMRRIAQFIEIGAVFLFCTTVLAGTPVFMALHGEMLTETLEAPTQLVIAIIPISMAVILFHAFVRLLTVLTLGAGDKGRVI